MASVRTPPSSPTAPGRELEGPDEEARAAGFAPGERRLRGMYFTPAPVVDAVLRLIAPHVASGPPLAIIDPACGAGAFLVAAARAFPGARLLGLEQSPEAAAQARQRLPEAELHVGDALTGGLDALLGSLPPGAFQLWLGNPPYNGTSPLLGEASSYAQVRGLLPAGYPLPRGTSLRDDFAFFLLRVARHLRQAEGLLGFLTPSTLLDAFLYAPIRHALLDSLQLREVAELGAGIFQGARVRTCFTLWASRSPELALRSAPRFRARGEAAPEGSLVWEESQPLVPAPPSFCLRPPSLLAEQLHARWTAAGEPLTSLIPVHFPGLKTRFDELLVDESPEKLLARIEAFLRSPAEKLAAFSEAHAIPARHLAKLRALHHQTRGLEPEAGAVRRFYRYRGSRHRLGIPAADQAFCYLHRRFIPRGDHRLQGGFDPHACAFKLVFNTRELPLAATTVTEAGCVHAHRHTRFAPLLVPRDALERGRRALRNPSRSAETCVNLSERGRAFAESHGGAEPFFRALARFINGGLVQNVWSPAFGAALDLPIPLDAGMFHEGQAPT